MTPEDYIATLKPPARSAELGGSYWAEEIGLSPAPDDIAGWRNGKDVALEPGQSFPYDLIVQAALPDVTRTPEIADVFLATLGKLEAPVAERVTPEVAAATATAIVGLRIRTPPATPHAKVLNWALGRITEPEQRATAVRAGLDEAPRNASTGAFYNTTSALLQLIDDPIAREAAEAYAAAPPPTSGTSPAATRSARWSTGRPRPGGGPEQSGGGPTTGGFPKQPGM